ncbi:peroxisomal succinyl-coenzyme A thioesterase-like isoform X2 [Antennarius striatus]|uniref:peroxisomal succinyl-coenzyme A thioesterase-like isoform X2 n=1 Tax=Antennarius striatus TaxID=241820 RepID=UPI0035AF39A6
MKERLSTMAQSAPPVLSVVPTRALVDEKFKVVVENLAPGSPVTLHSFHQSEDQDYWEAFGHYISDHRGAVSVAEDFSFGGTYTGVEVMGLLWSMRPAPGSREGNRLRKKNVCTPMLVSISVYRGHLAEGFRDQSPLASVLIERWYMAPGVQRINIREKGVRGTLFIPPGPGPFPGVLDMWGGGGGLVEYRSSLLASHSYASFALEYFTDGQAEVELSYFEAAFNILKDHPQVRPDRIGIFGICLGSSVAMHMVTRSTIVKPLCCVCVSGFHVIIPGFGKRQINELLNKYSNVMRVDENNHHIWREIGLQIMKDPSKKLNMGNISCPLLLVNGLDDQNCAASKFAEDIFQTLNATGKDHLLTTVQYPGAGHLIEPPFSPHNRATTFLTGTNSKLILLWGGQTKAHADAQEDGWKRILVFLQRHLYSSIIPKAKAIIDHGSVRPSGSLRGPHSGSGG